MMVDRLCFMLLLLVTSCILESVWSLSTVTATTTTCGRPRTVVRLDQDASCRPKHDVKLRRLETMVLFAANDDDDSVKNENLQAFLGGSDDEPPVIRRDSNAPDIDGAIWEDLETGRPPQLLVMKQVSE
jgi:hypothetical protein